MEPGLCYFLVCFNRLEFVAFLIASLLRPQDTFLIHCDKKAPVELKRYVAFLGNKYENIVQVESRDYSWAGYSHVAVTLQAMEYALSRFSHWSHFLCLSEQHLPLKSPAEIEGYLRSRKSVARITVATSMLPEAQADIRNRFTARYRELPGVGCFAIGLSLRDDAFYEKVFHGSNWLALHRDHCSYLLACERKGEFDTFKTIVHAEEMAIPSILAGISQEIDDSDITLVAAPHLVENHGLEMTDELYLNNIDSTYLFIRKRTNILNLSISERIRNNHFIDELYNDRILFENRPKAPLLKEEGADNAKALAKSISLRLNDRFQVHYINPTDFPFSCCFHLVVRNERLGKERSIRVLSQNLRDFKVCLIEESTHGTEFVLPSVEGGALHSTLRVKLSGLFGLQEITPLTVADSGFVEISENGSVCAIVKTIEDIHEYTQTPASPTTVLKIEPEGEIAEIEMTRASRINALAELVNAKTYLEVGACSDETFFAVNITEKVAVAPNFYFDFESRSDAATSFHKESSDQYFASERSAAFDIIYLDGLHTFEQTSRDFFNSMRLSHDNTIWLIDDTVPNDVFSSLPDQADCYRLRAQTGNTDASWMGDVYKCIYLIERLLPFYQFRTFEGHGQTVVWKSKRARALLTEGINLARIGEMSFVDMVRSGSALRFASQEEILEAIRMDFS